MADSCPLGGAPKLLNTLAMASITQVHACVDSDWRVWLALHKILGNATVHYGTYTEAGVLSLGGESGVLATSDGLGGVAAMAIDQQRKRWFVHAHLNRQLAYGSYASNGLPTKVGSISLGGNALYSLQVDTIRRIWWASGAGELVYGTYTEAGVPSKVGSVAVANLGYFDVDVQRGLIFGLIDGALHVASYNTTTGVPGTWVNLTTVDITGFRTLRVDSKKRLVFVGNYHEGTQVQVFRYSSSGSSAVKLKLSNIGVTYGYYDIDVDRSLLLIPTLSDVKMYKYC